ncbi:hypothetical protein Poli38472_000341 [Pythium oligandrum]|uniref:Ion transport domain-containing protein n=1 Tax=Pythium oligandrum TaxID=41045 RepID=A0A8K1FGR8_PYTOL|nr:hypothetical protein Poli38472_000341 [Pythium oligandrum]|eukprot:TMW60299.1 hypothetical protein Poli38472_000341 [Pythium oligandrum]
MREELNRMVESILSVEATLKEEFNPDYHLSYVRLTFDQVVSRLVSHVEALHDSSYVKTNVILLEVFCRMINAVDDWERKHQMQIKLNKLGVTKLVVQLIATREDDAIFERSIELGVALLDGMNAEVQESFFRYWMQDLGPSFCAELERRIRTACKHIRSGHKEGVHTSKLHTQDGHHTSSIHEKYLMPEEKRQVTMRDDKDASVNNCTMPSDGDRLRISGGPTTNLFRFLQLLCEGHYLAAQRYFIAQPNAKSSVNLVETTTSFLLETYLALADLDISLVIQLFETITELCQGPCIEAQETVANFKFISSVNALMMHSFSQTSRSELFLVRRLRASIVVTLLSLLEGRSDQVIHAHLVQELNFEALQRNLVESYTHFLMEYEGKYAGNTKCSDDFYLDMGFNIYFLLQQLADFFPSSATWLPRQRAEKYEWSCSSASKHSPSDSLLFVALSNGLTPEYHEAFHFFQSHSARVEIVWNHQRNPADKRGASNARASSGTQKRGNEDGEGNAMDSSDQGDVISYYFPLHPVCFCLTEQSKKKLVWNVSRGGNKLQDFYNRSDKLVDEMAHQSRLQQHPILAVCSRRSDLLKRLSFALAVGINLTVLLFYQADGIDSSPYPATRVTFVVSTDDVVSAPSKTIDIALSSAGTVQLVLCCLTLVCYLINSAPLLIKKGWKRRIQAAAELQSKKSASAHRLVRNVEDKETFQDTEQLLRSLRDREEEYDFMFLPRRNPKSRQYLATPHQDMMSNVASSRPTNLWERISHSLFTPRQLLPSNHYHTRGRPSVAATSDVATTFEYIRTVSISMYFLLRSPRVIYYEWMIFIAVLGSYVNKLFFAFHLLDVVTRFQELSNVLRAIARPAKVLGATVLLYLVIVYVFSTIGFFFFREDYNPTQTLTPAQRAGRDSYQCQRLFQCFLISLDQGFKSDGGLGGYLKQRSIGKTSETYGRLAFDLLYNTVLLIMLLNIVFGVIIDTFALLRTADNEKLMDMQSRCFICSIDAYTFDRMTRRGFHDHIYMDHNMWHYLYLFVHIRKKLITEYNGLELYLAMRMAKKDVSFFPSHRALSLEKATDDTIVNHAVKPSGSMFDGEPSSFHPRHNGANTHERSAHSERPFSPQSSLYPSGVKAPSQSTQRGRRRSSLTGSGEASAENILSNKLEKLEATIESLLATQSELKDHQVRAVERHAELIQIILSMRGHHAEVENAATPIGMAASRPTSTMTTLPSPTRIYTGDAQPSLAPESLRSASATSTARRRHSSSPRVFKFDSIGEDT